MARRKIRLEQEKEIVAMYEAGQSANSIAKGLGVHPATIRMAFHRHDVRMRSGRQVFVPTEKDIQSMVTLYQGGSSQKEIGSRFGVSQTTISRFLEVAGVTMRRGAFGEAHGNWKGGRHEKDGYVFVRLRPDSPFYSMTSNGYVAEHRLKMAKKLNRPLLEGETVHHKNGDHSNNHLRNLQLRQPGRHGKGIVLQCLDCSSHNIQPAPLPKETH